MRKEEALMAGKTTKKRITFELHAPEAREVCLAGNFNGWDSNARPLKQQKNGTWKTTVSLEPGVYEYRFLVDGCWVDDPRCMERTENEFGSCNCLIRV
jgi:1,4-alpha-glucan branching enzyme